MKKLLLLLILLPTLCFAEDRVNVQVRFRKAIWACPSGREITDLNVGSPSVYEHTCSDGTWLNSFKEYNGILTYTPEEFEKADSKEKDTAKDKLVGDYLYQVDNPPPYVEPKVSDYEQQIADKQAEIESLQVQKAEAVEKLAIKELNEKIIISR